MQLFALFAAGLVAATAAIKQEPLVQNVVNAPRSKFSILTDCAIGFYNKNDAEGFAGCFDPNAAIMQFPDNALLGKGREAIAESMVEQLKLLPSVTLVNQIIIGEKLFWHLLFNNEDGEAVFTVEMADFEGTDSAKTIWVGF